MSLFFFYNNRKPKKYEHKPIYWDPQKEALEERIAKIKREMGIEQDEHSYKSTIKGSFINASPHLKRKIEKGEDSEKRKMRNSIIAVVLVILLIVFYYFYF